MPRREHSRRAGRRLGALGAWVAALCLLAAAPASAVTCVAAPGTAAAEEYCENVPTAGGDRPAGSPAGGGPSVSGRARDQLARSSDGRGLLAFSDATSPRRSGSAPDSDQPGGGSAIGAALGDGPWAHGLLPWLLAAIACGLAAAALVRRRLAGTRTSTSSSRSRRPSA